MSAAPRRRARLAVAAIALLLGGVREAREARAQCTVGAPYEFLSVPGPYPRFRTGGYVNNFGLYRDTNGIQRLLSADNYGYYIFSLGNPAAPSYLSVLDIEQTLNRVGDTFSIIDAIATAPDGSRALVSTGRTPSNGVLLMKGVGSAFAYAGDFKPANARAVVLDQVGDKWWGYAFTDGYLRVADVTNFFTGSPPTKPGSIASEAYGIGSVVPRNPSVASHLIVFATGGGITAVDARKPTTYLPYTEYSAAALGFPGGTSVERVSAVTHPNGKVYVVAEGVVNGNETAGFVLGTLSADGGTFTRIGNRWMPPAPFSGSGSISSSSRPALVSDDGYGDVWVFVWGGSSTGALKLFGLSAADWEARGTPVDLTPNASYQASSSWAAIATTEPLVVGSTFYLYVGATNSAQALKLTCKPPVAAPSIHLAFVNGGVEYPLCGQPGACVGGRFAVATGQELVAYAYSGGAVDPAPPGGLAWSFGGTGAPQPTTGTGQGVHFRFTAPADNVEITMSGYPQTYSFQGRVSDALVVSATAAPNPGKVGESVQFGATASGGTPPYSYTWTFGDGTTSTMAGPGHAYASAGTYPVTCSVRDANGTTQSAQLSVTIDAVIPSALALTLTDTATGDPLFEVDGAYRVTSRQSVTFTARDGEALAIGVVWRFGDGQVSTQNPATHMYANDADAEMTFPASVSAGGVTILFTVAVAKVIPDPTGVYTYAYADAGSVGDGGAVDTARVDPSRAVRFTAPETADSYEWDFGDGSAHATTRVADHTFPSTGGTYRVTLREMKGGTTFTTASPVAFTVPAPRWMLVGMASTEGQGGAYWRSDVTLANPSAVQSMTLRVAFLDTTRTIVPSELLWATVTLPPGGARTLVDALGNGSPAEWGLSPANRSGALLVSGDALPTGVEPLVVGKTYNTGSAETGTFGLSIPPVRVTDGLRAQDPAWARQLIGLRQTDDHYTNLGVVNLQADDAEAEVRFFDASGLALGQPVTFQVGPYGIQQRNNVLRDAAGFTGSVDSFRATVTVKKGAGLTAYASVTDVRSKDPVFVAPRAGSGTSYRLPGIVRAAGANGSLFRSDVVLHSTAAASRTFSLGYTYRTSASPGLKSASWDVVLAAGQVLDIDDFVKTQLGLPDSDDASYTDSFVDVTAKDTGTEPLLVQGRTYNQQPGGSTGLQVKAYGPEDTASAGGPRKRLAITGLRSSGGAGGGFRSNVALFLGTPGAAGSAQVTLRLLDGSGVERGSRTVTLDAATPFAQLADATLFGGATWDLSTITVLVDVVSGTAPVAGYATVLDNVSNDAVFLPATPLP